MAASSYLHLSSILLFFFLLSGSNIQTHGQEVGINYGRMADNIPSPNRVAQLLQSMGVRRAKIYDADPSVLRALANTNIELTIGLGNEYLNNMNNPTNVQAWIQANVQPYINQTKITSIVVGNEILGGNDQQLESSLSPAMEAVYEALTSLGLTNQITVTTAHSSAILQSSYPPSAGSFKLALQLYLKQILDFHSKTKSPFFFNAYPYYAYKANPNNISLDYCFFKPNNQEVTDSITNLHYDNMLSAQLDAVYAAIQKLGHDDIQVVVSETGWPSKGDPDEVGASVENAAAYNGNLIKWIEKKEGTPSKPSVPISAYVFALFNEDLKQGPTSERNYGLYYPDATPVYNIGLPLHTLSGIQKMELGKFAFFSSFLTAILILG